MEKKYYTLRSKPLAYALKYITGQSFYKFNQDDESYIYSFERTDNLMKALTELNSIRQTTK